MSFYNRRVFWLVIFILIVFLGPITVILNTSFNLSQNSDVLINIFQRIVGLTAFSLLFIQIILGNYMEKWVQLIGGFAFRLHIVNGVFILLLVLVHPFLYFLSKTSDVKTFIKMIIFPQSETIADVWVNFGRIALTLLVIGTTAGYYRTKPFFRNKWLLFHYFHYLAFAIISIHSYYIGTDVKSWPFYGLFMVANGVYLMLIATKINLYKLIKGRLADDS